MTQEKPPLLTPEQENKRILNKSLSSIGDEYKKFIKKHGEPIRPEKRFETIDFRQSCKEIRLFKVVPIIEKWQTDKNQGVRHWPSIAFAVSNYKYARRNFQKEQSIPPAEVKFLIKQVIKSSNSLRNSLERLQKLSCEISDPIAPQKTGHIGWIKAIFDQAISGEISPELNKDALVNTSDHFIALEFLRKLVHLEAAATFVLKSRLDMQALAKRSGPNNDPALIRLVDMCKSIWTSLSGLKPSASPRNIRAGDTEPRFVLFIQELVALAGGPSPSRKQVETALRQ